MTLRKSHTPVCLAVFISSAFAAEIVPNRDALVVHEWGTFTSVAGDNGDATAWAPLATPPDLPCFVNHLGPPNAKAGLATVRMETPVLYFYPQHDLSLSVDVQFPNGWITEWYPQATHVKPSPSKGLMFGDYQNGQIAWDHLEASPAQSAAFPTGAGSSRYYAARNTDSAPLTIDGQHEKMIFYRGIGNFAIPLRAHFDSQGVLEVTNTGDHPIPMLMWFENRDGRIGFRILRDSKSPSKVQPPEMTAGLDDVRSSLTAALVANGLYPKEAAAMIETWHDSWFEAGSRLIYLVPRPMVDTVLPLNVSPAPTATARVFVGRLEVLSPAVRNRIATALAAGDVPALAKFGRFLEPFLIQMGLQHDTADALQQARTQLWKSFETPCIK